MLAPLTCVLAVSAHLRILNCMNVDTSALRSEVNTWCAQQAAERDARRQARQLQRAVHAERRRLGLEGRHRRKLARRPTYTAAALPGC